MAVLSDCAVLSNHPSFQTNSLLHSLTHSYTQPRSFFPFQQSYWWLGSWKGEHASFHETTKSFSVRNKVLHLRMQTSCQICVKGCSSPPGNPYFLDFFTRFSDCTIPELSQKCQYFSYLSNQPFLIPSPVLVWGSMVLFEEYFTSGY